MAQDPGSGGSASTSCFVCMWALAVSQAQLLEGLSLCKQETKAVQGKGQESRQKTGLCAGEGLSFVPQPAGAIGKGFLRNLAGIRDLLMLRNVISLAGRGGVLMPGVGGRWEAG